MRLGPLRWLLFAAYALFLIWSLGLSGQMWPLELLTGAAVFIAVPHTFLHFARRAEADGEYDRAVTLYLWSQWSARAIFYGALRARAALEMSNMLVRQEQFAEAAAQCETAVRYFQWRSSSRIGQCNLAASLNRLGVIRFRQSRLQEAREIWQQSLALWDRYGPAHPGRAQTLANLGELHTRHNAAEASAEFRRRAASIRPRETPQALPALKRLGSSLEEQGKLGDAALVWESVLSGMERTHERSAHALLEPLAALVRIYRGQGRHEHMDAVYLRWLDCQAAQLGRRHPRMAGYDLDYAREWLARGDARRAWARLGPWAAASSDQAPAPQISLAAACGQCEGIQGNWHAASEHYRSAVAACRSTPQA